MATSVIASRDYMGQFIERIENFTVDVDMNDPAKIFPS